jgi:hypothetical protein
MIEDDDLEAAVAEGVLTQAQVDALRTFEGGRQVSAERADDERFRFMRGFNDFFFAVGIVLFGAGITFFSGISPLYNLFAAILIWALAELLVGRMRLVLPGILLVSLLAFFVFRMTRLDWSYIAPLLRLPFHPVLQPRTISGALLGILEPVGVAGKALAAGLAATVFYVRFRLPFALLVIAGSVVLILMMILGSILFPGPTSRSLILLGCGLGVFAAAMAYDLSDRMRTTRTADCAFWLHLLAAPLIVHSLIQLIVPNAITGAVSMTTMSAVTIFVIVAILAAIAVLIDRRALLVSALSYLGIAIGYTLTKTVQSGVDNRPVVIFSTLLILGAMVLILGAGWQPLRRVLLRLVPSAFVNRLPPAAYPA